MARSVAITSHLAPVPPGFKPRWRDILEEYVAIYRRLPEDLTLVVEELIPWFIEKVEWEWSHWEGASPDKELHQVCVACEACLLIARRSKKEYAHFKKFIFFPTDLDPVREDCDAAGDASSSRGRIRQGWYWTKEGMEDGGDNYNVTIHEFAHMLDFGETGNESVPAIEKDSAKRDYKKFMEREYKDICHAWEKKTNNGEVIRKYATTDKIEFFTCATEAFFERSEMLKYLRGELYAWMKKIYRMDPAQWEERFSHAELQKVRYDGLSNWQTRTSWSSIAGYQKLPEWPVGLSAEQYNVEGERERQYLEERERLRKAQEEKIRQAKVRLERERRLAEEEKRLEREQRDRQARLRLERMERKARERQLLNNRTVVLEYPNGRPQLKYRLVNGFREGGAKRWDENGRLKEETEYSKGNKHGRVAYYYPSGQIDVEGFFSMNERFGIWKGWHEDGTPSFRSEYREGELHSWEQFGENGDLRTYGKVKNRFGL